MTSAVVSIFLAVSRSPRMSDRAIVKHPGVGGPNQLLRYWCQASPRICRRTRGLGTPRCAALRPDLLPPLPSLMLRPATPAEPCVFIFCSPVVETGDPDVILRPSFSVWSAADLAFPLLCDIPSLTQTRSPSCKPNHRSNKWLEQLVGKLRRRPRRVSAPANSTGTDTVRSQLPGAV